MKFVTIRFKTKDKNGKLTNKEMIINIDTIKRIVKRTRTLIIVTPLLKRGFKNQVISLDRPDFGFLMEQLDVK